MFLKAFPAKVRSAFAGKSVRRTDFFSRYDVSNNA
jgi:hypothetical protein